MTTSRLPRDDLRAALAARRELGPDYDDAFADAVAERIEQALDARVPHHAMPRPMPPPVPQHGSDRAGVLTIAILSLVAAIPLTAIAADMAGLPGLVVAWLGLTAINVAYALGRHR